MKRRSLLILGGAGALAIRCGGMGGSLQAEVPAGNASSLTAGTLRAVAGQGVAIGRDARGIYALSLICTHEGCDISQGGFVSGSGIQCPCHGAIYDAQGNVLGGPAHGALVHFAVTEDGSGALTIHTDQQVPESTRLG